MSIFSRFWHSIKGIFDNDLSDEERNAIHIGVVVVEKIKDFTDSVGADVLTEIIPGEIDDNIKEALRSALPNILVRLKLAENCTGLTDPNEIVICAIQTLAAVEGDFKSAFLHDLSILVAQVASDGKLDWKDGAMLLEWYYQHKYQNK